MCYSSDLLLFFAFDSGLALRVTLKGGRAQIEGIIIYGV